MRWRFGGIGAGQRHAVQLDRAALRIIERSASWKMVICPPRRAVATVSPGSTFRRKALSAATSGRLG
jgi:hypothetical protein